MPAPLEHSFEAAACSETRVASDAAKQKQGVDTPRSPLRILTPLKNVVFRRFLHDRPSEVTGFLSEAHNSIMSF